MTTSALIIQNVSTRALSIGLRFSPTRQLQRTLLPGASVDVSSIASFAELNNDPNIQHLLAAGAITVTTTQGTSDIPGFSYASANSTGGTKAPCRAATTANITLAGTQTIDTIAVVAGDRVLVKNQTDDTENGIYVVSGGTWSRASDAATPSQLPTGFTVAVADGSVNATTTWIFTTDPPITLGTTSLSFTQPTGAALASVAPADVTAAAAAVGTGLTAARADHKHNISTGTPVATGSANAAGSATSLAKSDHVHVVGAATILPSMIAVADGNGVGVALMLRAALASGGATGTADDVVIFNANAPYKFRVVDAHVVISTAGAGSSSAVLRSASGGSGTVLSGTMATDANGIARASGTGLTATATVAAGGTLALRRSDRSAVGELFVTIVRET